MFPEQHLKVNDNKIEIEPIYRGHIKLALINIGYPVQDLAGYKLGEEYRFNLREKLASNGEDFILRDYQKNSVDAFYSNGGPERRSGSYSASLRNGKNNSRFGNYA